MALHWTKEQEQVIKLRNRNILVSAAAGSGKTAVLVERILTMITKGDEPLDIDRLLVVTFTRAAAGEMKERLLKALDERLEKEPENEHLQRQTAFIHHAQINTIDGFCSYVIRNYFHVIDLDPGYRTADEGELKLLKTDVVKEVLEDAYAKGTEEFHNFIEWYATGKSDAGIEELILRLYEFAMSHPWPKEWLLQCKEAYVISGSSQLEQSLWMKKLWADVAQNLEEAGNIIEVNLQTVGEEEGPYMYEEAIHDDQKLLQALQASGSYAAFYEILSSRKYARLSPKRDESVSNTKKEQVKVQREEFKEILKNLEEQYFFGEDRDILESMRKCAPIMETLVDLTSDFMERFATKKRKKNLLDFTDMEHLALDILVHREDGEWVRTQVAEELSEQFMEILIDEYQDSNYVQEMLLTSVSRQHRGENNIFMVGDVKQSIYRFRLACPDLFMEKYQAYSKEESKCQRIDLHKNFRSREEVLEGVNFVFHQIMSKALGNIEYDEAAALYPGADFPERKQASFIDTEILIAQKDSEMMQAYKAPMIAQELEARVVATRIREIVGSKQILDKASNTYRPARYSDCVILLRTISGWADIFGRVLGAHGIPSYVTSKTGYFSALEIVTILNYLHICDNPMQEIPFTAVLCSPIGGCTVRELALIKSAFTEEKIYAGCVRYITEGEDAVLIKKLKRFDGIFQEVRGKISDTPIHELILYLLEQTGYSRYVSAMPGGEQRTANIHMLVEKAMEFEKTSYRGLFNFIRYIEYLQKYNVDFGEVNLVNEQEDTVRIMSIHKSKGLEFPIVFVSGMGKKFNLTDINMRVVMHPDYGIGTDCIDPRRRLKTPILLKQVIRRQTLGENLGEEMRVLYVAMTRAKEKLILTGTIDRLERRVMSCHRLMDREETVLPYTLLLKTRDYWGWILPAMARNQAFAPLYERYGIEGNSSHRMYDEVASIKIKVMEPEELVTEELGRRIDRQMQKERYKNWDTSRIYDERLHGILQKRFEFLYPYEAQKGIPVKVTVSELKKKYSQDSPDEAGEELFFEPDIIPFIPRFIEERKEISGADRGTAYHRIMECLDLLQTDTQEQVEAQLEEMNQEKKIDSQLRSLVKAQDIFRFMQSDLGKRMKRAQETGQLYKEQPFMMSVPASEKDSRFSDEDSILVQGIVDVFFYEDDEIILVDYKTDKVWMAEDAILIDKYEKQLDYYAMALERTTGKKVKEKIIYSFTLQKEIFLRIS